MLPIEFFPANRTALQKPSTFRAQAIIAQRHAHILITELRRAHGTGEIVVIGTVVLIHYGVRRNMFIQPQSQAKPNAPPIANEKKETATDFHQIVPRQTKKIPDKWSKHSKLYKNWSNKSTDANRLDIIGLQTLLLYR